MSRHCATALGRLSGLTVLCLLVGLVLASTPASAAYNLLTSWGGRGSAPGQFIGLSSIATDTAGNVYAADSVNYRIQKFTTTGSFTRQWGQKGSGAGEFLDPLGVATDSAGNVYVVEQFNNRVQKLTSDGAYITSWGSTGRGNGQFRFAYQAAVDTAGNVYVLDNGNSRVQKFTSTGKFLTKWGRRGSGRGELNQPQDIAVDGADNVFVLDWKNNRVQKFTSSGRYLTEWGSKGSGNGQFDEPEGIAVDPLGSVFVSDTGNNRVQKFDSAGFVTKFGTKGLGPGQLYIPQAIDVDSSCDVYVGDHNPIHDESNQRIQKFGDPGLTCGDTKDPKVVVRTRSRRASGLTLRVRCPGEPCTARASATVSLSGAARVYRARSRLRQFPRRRSAILRLRFRGRMQRAARRALRVGRRPRVRLTVAVEDGAGNSTRRKRTLRLKG